MKRKVSKPGRKPLPESERKSRRIVLLFRPAEGEAVDRAAGGKNNAATWAAEVVLDEAVRKTKSE